MQLTTTRTRPAAQDVLQPVQNFAFSSIMACGLSIARQWGADAHPACERRSSWAGVVLMRSHCWTAGSSRRRIDVATWCLSSWRLPFHCCGLRNLCGGLSSKRLSAELALNSISAACMLGNGWHGMQWCWSGADSCTFSHAAAVACADSAWSAQLLLCAVYLYQLVPLTPELSAQPCSQHHGHSIAAQSPLVTVARCLCGLHCSTSYGLCLCCVAYLWCCRCVLPGTCLDPLCS